MRLFVRYAVAPPQRGRHQNARRLIGSRFNERGKLLYSGLDLPAAPDVHRRKSRLGELTERLAELLCRRKGIAMESAAPITMQAYREQQFDLLADGVRHALDMPAVYAAMGLTGPKEERT